MENGVPTFVAIVTIIEDMAWLGLGKDGDLG